MSAPLPFFSFEEIFRNRIVKREVTPSDWRLEVTPPAEEGKVYANITVSGINGSTCELNYDAPNSPFSFQTTLSTVEQPKKDCGSDSQCCEVVAKANTVLQRFAPAVTYKEKHHSVTAKLATGHVDYTFTHPAFFGTASVHATGGFATLATLSSRIQQNLYGGLYLNYDPFRSGLRNYTVSILARNVAAAKHGDVLVSLDATRGVLLGFSAPIKNTLQGTFTVRPHKAMQTLVAGLDYRSPCGAQALAHVDVGQQLLGVTLSRLIHDTWRVSLGWTISNANNTVTPKFGLAVSKDF